MVRVSRAAGVVVAVFSGVLGCDAVLGLKRATLYQPDAGTGGKGGGTGGAASGGGGQGGGTTCHDGKTDGTESDTDCGGSCPACGDGQHCNTGSDCQSMVCAAGVCAPLCTTPPCPGDTLWAKRYGDMAEQHAQGVTARATDVVATGWFAGTVDFGGGPITATATDVFLLKLAATDGGHVWSKRFGGDATSYQYGEGVALDAAGNTVVVGEFSDKLDLGGGPMPGSGGTDIFLGKLNPSGGHIWSAHFGDGADQYGGAVALDANGAVIITGRNEGVVDFGGGPITNPAAGMVGGGSVYVAKFDAGGSHVWSHGYGDGSDEYGVSVAADPKGDVLVVATGGGSFDFGGGLLTGAGGGDIFVAKLAAADGTIIWAKRFGDESTQYGEHVATDSTGNVYVLSSGLGAIDFGGGPLVAVGDEDIFIAKLSPQGEHLWSHRYGFPGGTASGASLAVDGGGNVIVTGSFTGQINFGGGALASAGGSDVFLFKLSKDGKYVWSRRYGDPSGNQAANALALAGNIFFTGQFSGSVDFGSGILTSAGHNDAFIAKVLP
jgi:hypothetical protein